MPMSRYSLPSHSIFKRGTGAKGKCWSWLDKDGQDGEKERVPRVRRSRPLYRGRVVGSAVPISMARKKKVMKKQRRSKEKGVESDLCNQRRGLKYRGREK
jgi:hypothetical protein